MATANGLMSPPPTFPRTFPKPQTDWNHLTRPIEATAQKACRFVGIFLTVLTIPSAGATYYVRHYLTASPDTIITSFYLLRRVTVISAVLGIAFWYWSGSRPNLTPLLRQRLQLKDQIETSPLAKFYQSFPGLVISTQELNEWMRYFLQTQPFVHFITSQTDQIFHIPMEPETVALFKEKYREYLTGPFTRPGLTQFVKQGPYIHLLSDAEKKELSAEMALAEAHYANDGAGYQRFIERNGIEALELIKTHGILRNLSAAYIAYVNEQKKGICDLNVKELEYFKSFLPPNFHQHIAEREAAGSYEDFVRRNGIGAIIYLRDDAVKQGLLVRFQQHVLKRNLGLVKTREVFKEALDQFAGTAVEEISRAILQHEWSQLSTMTYKQFRERNGFDSIALNAAANVETLQFFKTQFLQLPFADLTNPDFAKDREQLGITDSDIKYALGNRWNALKLKQVLDGNSGFLEALKVFFSPSDWTAKAVEETQNMSVAAVIKNYAPLFAAGVLSAKDGNLSARLAAEIAPAATFSQLRETYGAFIFDYKLVDPCSPKICLLIIDHLLEKAESYLVEPLNEDDFAIRYMFADLRTILLHRKTQRNEALRLHEDTIKKLYTRRDKAHNWLENRKQAKTAAAAEAARIPAKQKALATLEKDLSEAKIRHQSLEREVRALGDQMSRKIETSNDSFPLELRVKQLEAMNIPTLLSTRKAALSGAKQDLERLQATIEQYLLNTPVPQLKLEIKNGEQEIEKFKSWQTEQEELAPLVKSEEFKAKKKALEDRLANPEKKVTGLDAALQAKAAAPNLKKMEEQERRLKELEEWEARNRRLSEEVARKQTEVTLITEGANVLYGLENRRRLVKSFSEQVSEWEQKQTELESARKTLEDLRRVPTSRGLSIVDKVQELGDAAQQLSAATLLEASARQNLEGDQLKLAEKTTKIHKKYADRQSANTKEIETQARTERELHAEVLSSCLEGLKNDIQTLRLKLKAGS